MMIYSVKIKTSNLEIWDDIFNWCCDNFGKRLGRWKIEGTEKGLCEFKFAYKEDAALFKLTWG